MTDVVASVLANEKKVVFLLSQPSVRCARGEAEEINYIEQW